VLKYRVTVGECRGNSARNHNRSRLADGTASGAKAAVEGSRPLGISARSLDPEAFRSERASTRDSRGMVIVQSFRRRYVSLTLFRIEFLSTLDYA